MRSCLLLVLLLAVLLASVSAVSVPYKWCGKPSDDATISSIDSNSWPPKSGDPISLNVTGNLSKEVTDGRYLITPVWNTITLPPINGSIAAFRSLPWPVGLLNFTYELDLPKLWPGDYQVTISAADQDHVQIFCIQVKFTLSLQPTDSEQPSTTLPSGAEPSSLERMQAARNPVGGNSRRSALLNKAQRIKDELDMLNTKTADNSNRV